MESIILLKGIEKLKVISNKLKKHVEKISPPNIDRDHIIIDSKFKAEYC